MPAYELSRFETYNIIVAYKHKILICFNLVSKLNLIIYDIWHFPFILNNIIAVLKNEKKRVCLFENVSGMGFKYEPPTN